MTVKDIYTGAERLINLFIKKEIALQGHTLTGTMEDSLDGKYSKSGAADLMEGFAVDYTKYVNDGVPAASASMKQFPYLVNYFKLRGLGDKEAKGAAAATIKTWMREGMSTQASKRFSQTGARQNFIDSAFMGSNGQLDEYMTNSFDFAVDELYHKEKSETV